jgi:hypothetical protein
MCGGLGGIVAERIQIVTRNHGFYRLVKAGIGRRLQEKGKEGSAAGCAEFETKKGLTARGLVPVIAQIEWGYFPCQMCDCL